MGYGYFFVLILNVLIISCGVTLPTLNVMILKVHGLTKHRLWILFGDIGQMLSSKLQK